VTYALDHFRDLAHFVVVRMGIPRRRLFDPSLAGDCSGRDGRESDYRPSNNLKLSIISSIGVRLPGRAIAHRLIFRLSLPLPPEIEPVRRSLYYFGYSITQGLLFLMT
jgi:hypothetical protein